MTKKLSDAEISVMQIIWEHGTSRAAEIAQIAHDQIGWETNTTYTLINRLIKKGAVKRTNPGFVCETLLSETEVRLSETKGLLNRMYAGSLPLMVKSFLDEKNLSNTELDELRKLIDEKR